MIESLEKKMRWKTDDYVTLFNEIFLNAVTGWTLGTGYYVNGPYFDAITSTCGFEKGELYGYGLYSYGLYSYGLYSYGLYSDGLYRYGLYSYGMYSYGLYSYGLYSYGLYSDCLYRYGLYSYGMGGVCNLLFADVALLQWHVVVQS